MASSTHSVCRGKYDVDLLYYEGNLRYVLTHFKPVLEEQLGLNICLPERDHVAGIPIADNIISSSENSRHCIILFCEKFYDAHWNSFASHVALHGMLSQGGQFRAIPVFISRCSVDSKFKQYHHLDITEEHQRGYFWWKLCQSMNISCSRSTANSLPVPPTIEVYNHQMSLQNVRNQETSDDSYTPPGGPPSITSTAYPQEESQPEGSVDSTRQDSEVSTPHSAPATGMQTFSEEDLNVLKMMAMFVLGIFAYKMFKTWTFF